jgi:hypothetical protein
VVGLLESKGMHDALTDQAYADTSKALGLIKLYMDSSMLSMMNGIDNCADAWDALQNLFIAWQLVNLHSLIASIAWQPGCNRLWRLQQQAY